MLFQPKSTTPHTPGGTVAKGRPRILIIHRNHRAEAAQIERELNGSARVRVIWQPEEIFQVAEQPPMDEFDAIVLFPMTIRSQPIHERIATQFLDHEEVSIVAIGRSGDWNGGRQRVDHFCRTPTTAVRTLQEQFIRP